MKNPNKINITLDDLDDDGRINNVELAEEMAYLSDEARTLRKGYASYEGDGSMRDMEEAAAEDIKFNQEQREYEADVELRNTAFKDRLPAANSMAEFELYGSGNSTVRDPETGEVISDAKNPKVGLIEQMRNDRKYGKTQEDRDAYATAYGDRIKSLLNEEPIDGRPNIELAQAKLIADLDLKATQKRGDMIGRQISNGMDSDDAVTHVDNQLRRLESKRREVILESGSLTLEDYDRARKGLDVYEYLYTDEPAVAEAESSLDKDSKGIYSDKSDAELKDLMTTAEKYGDTSTAAEIKREFSRGARRQTTGNERLAAREAADAAEVSGASSDIDTEPTSASVSTAEASSSDAEKGSDGVSSELDDDIDKVTTRRRVKVQQFLKRHFSRLFGSFNFEDDFKAGFGGSGENSKEKTKGSDKESVVADRTKEEYKSRRASKELASVDTVEAAGKIDKPTSEAPDSSVKELEHEDYEFTWDNIVTRRISVKTATNDAESKAREAEKKADEARREGTVDTGSGKTILTRKAELIVEEAEAARAEAEAAKNRLEEVELAYGAAKNAESKAREAEKKADEARREGTVDTGSGKTILTRKAELIVEEAEAARAEAEAAKMSLVVKLEVADR